MTKLEKEATMHYCNFIGGWCFLYFCKNNLQKTLTKANVVCKVIIALHIYHKIFGIRYAGPPANKIKVLALIKF